MGHTPKSNQWVWVLVQNPGEQEQILGQHDEESNISFIPTFLAKEHGQKCYHFMVREKGKKDEFQAIIYEDLTRHAVENGFMIFLFNDSGEILEKIAP
jgi:hypothetical protein